MPAILSRGDELTSLVKYATGLWEMWLWMLTSKQILVIDIVIIYRKYAFM